MFTPIEVGELRLPNRVLFSACTRHRARVDGVPLPVMADYYAQRSSAGLMVTEGVSPNSRGYGYWNTPGLHTDEQQDGWQSVTERVHGSEGRVFAQLMHVGRMSHESMQPGGMSPVSASAVRPDPTFRGYAFKCPVPRGALSSPRALSTQEVESEIEDYVSAARRAATAGFDGVEVHAGSGYLPMQFLASGTNHRRDRFGGSVEGRCQFLLDLVDALAAVLGTHRVAVKLSPGFRFNDVHDDDPVATYRHLFRELGNRDLAYVLVSEYGDSYSYEPRTDWRRLAREEYRGVLIANGGLNRSSSLEIIESGIADAVAFGQLFIANPDLPERLEQDTSLNEPDVSTFYTQGHEGYIDYPRLGEELPNHLQVTYTGVEEYHAGAS